MHQAQWRGTQNQVCCAERQTMPMTQATKIFSSVWSKYTGSSNFDTLQQETVTKMKLTAMGSTTTTTITEVVQA